MSWFKGQKEKVELSAWFRVWLPRPGCFAHVLTLWIYTVFVESRFIYCSVKKKKKHIYVCIYIYFLF